MELEENRDEFRKQGLNVAAISYDSPAILKSFAERRNIRYPLLSDAGSKLITQLGLLNESVPKDNFAHGVPYPGVFVLDAKGKVTARYFEDDYRQRQTSAGILLKQFGLLPKSGRSDVEGKQLSLTASASNTIVRPFEKLSLVIDIELKPKMHVYAPGVQGYIPIAWNMAPTPTLTAAPIATPEPKVLFLEAIDEKVPVFEGKFRITRDITLASDKQLEPALDAEGMLNIEGKLRYQACDDKVCYIPQELPVKWRLRYEGFDKQRAPDEIRHR